MKVLILSSLLVVLGMSCQKEADKKMEMDHGVHKPDSGHEKRPHPDMEVSSRKPLNLNTKAALVSVLEANEELHAAFFDFQAEEVEKSAKKVLERMEKVENEEIAKLLEFSKKQLQEVKAEKARKELNEIYHQVSSALVHIVNTFDVGENYNAYSCPMVKKKWVQNSTKMAKVHNPYAPQMPHCGSKDTKY